MKKQDLKTGMRVMTRNENLYLVLKDCETYLHGHQDIFFANFNGSGFLLGSSYDPDLNTYGEDNDFDIMEVFDMSNDSYCGAQVLDKRSLYSIWERTE